MAGFGAFSSCDESAIKRSLDLPSRQEKEQKTEEELWKYYELEKCLQFISKHKNVSLQFPDHLLQDAAPVVTILQRESKQEVYVLGDTSYGSCCVDEVAAEHVRSEGIIHFGMSCLTETSRLPVLYVFGQEEIDIRDCREQFETLFTDRQEPVIVLYDVVYSYVIDVFCTDLSSLYLNLVSSQLLIPVSPARRSASDNTVVANGLLSSSGCGSCDCGKRDSDDVKSEVAQTTPPQERGLTDSSSEENPSSPAFKRFGRWFNITRPLSEYKIFYIGSEGPTLTNFMLSYRNNQFYSYNPVNKMCRLETKNVNQMLGKRYYLIQKSKEAHTIGILVGTLGAVNYLPMIERLKRIIKNAGKKSYTVAVGKLNPAKLANFTEIDLYVLVACPHCSLVDSQDYFHPIVTPYEMEVACLSSRVWTGDVIMSYQELLPGGAHYATESETNANPDFSFLTGRLLPTATEKEGGADETTIALKGSMAVSLPYSGANHLQNRSWQGLERKLGETPVETAPLEGREGLPMAYSHEREHD